MLPLVDDLPMRGFAPPAWTLGGGTALMLRHDHRLSRDIDVFLRDPQYLPALPADRLRAEVDLLPAGEPYAIDCFERVRRFLGQD